MKHQYTPTTGPYKDQVGVMVARLISVETDRIELVFNDGKMVWFPFDDVRRL